MMIVQPGLQKPHKYWSIQVGHKKGGWLVVRESTHGPVLVRIRGELVHNGVDGQMGLFGSAWLVNSGKGRGLQQLAQGAWKPFRHSGV